MMMFALLFLTAPLMLAVFDGGLLLNDRRDAQDLVDRAATAGALELLLDTSDNGAAAVDLAEQWVVRNGGNLTADAVTIVPTNTCFSENDPFPTGVTVTIERDAPTFLAGALGLDLRSGASATACAGVPIEYFGIFPLVVSAQGLLGTCFSSGGQPIPGSDCRLRVADSSQGLVGELSIDHPSNPNETVNCSESGSGASDLNLNLIHGVQAWCSVGAIVHAKPGQNINQTFNGIKGRLALDGACDAAFAAEGGTSADLQAAWSNLDAYLAAFPGHTHTPLPTSDAVGPMPRSGDGIDDFYEVWAVGDPSNPASELSPRDCPGYDGATNSPRNIVLIVVADTFDTANGKTYEILDFVRMYVEGCSREMNNGATQFRRDCGWSSLANGKITIHGRYVHQVAASSNNLGLTPLMLGDSEVFLLR